MSKQRVHELAKELNISNKEILTYLGAGYSAQSGLSDEEVEKVLKKHEEVQRGKSLEKKAVLLKAPKRDAAPQTESRTDTVPDKEPVKTVQTESARTSDEPKKKKPVFVFRPENSKTSFGDKFQKTGRPSTEQTVRPRRPEDDRTIAKPVQTGRIKPNVPTTAEQYREYVKQAAEASEKTETAAASTVEETKVTTSTAAETKQEQAPVVETVKTVETAAETRTETRPETVTKSEPETKKEETSASETTPESSSEQPKETVQAAPEKAEEKTVVSAQEKAKETVADEKPEQKAPKADKPVQLERPKVQPDKRPDRPNQNNQRPDQRAQQRPDLRPADRAQQDTRKKPETKVTEQAKRPSLTIVGRVDLNRVKEAEERKPAQDRKNMFDRTGTNRVHFVDNRNGQKAGDGKGGFQGRPQGQGSFRQGGAPSPFQKDKDSDSTRPGQKNNRGIFARNGAKTGANVHVNAGAGDKLVSKSDVRGKKSNFKTDKDRNTFEKDGKKAENFRNLSKDTQKHLKQEVKEEVIKMIVLPETITIKDLADKMKLKSSELIKKLFLKGKMVTVNEELSYEDAEALALEYDILCEKEEQVDVIEELLKEDEENEADLEKRPPVVCVMGHVDHGKTSLLDAIRSTNVTSREAGGITQHIGAYMVECKGEKITFLDTPGHEAFTAMRMRGAMATDIAILVVAADDGVMPQTVEAINHAKAAGVDVIVAVNKIDKPGANVDKVKQELMEYGLVSEEWGGNTIFVPISAKKRENIDLLLEMILLVTEVKELKANPNRKMRGLVIEAKLDKGRGPVATVLVQKGTMKPGDFVSAGSFYGRVRAMLDADGNQLKAALPSMPVEILGLNGVPNAGEVCIGHKNEKDARAYAETFIAEEKKKMLSETKHKLTMDTLFDQIQAGNIKELPIVLKADVQGSVEALKSSLEKLSNNEVAVKVIHSGVGAINESDVTLASASNAIVIGFNVKPDAQAKQIVEQESVDLKLYRVIYEVIDDVEAAMKGMLAPVYEEKVLGHAEIRVIFKSSGVGNIGGSYVLDGTLERGCKARITRGKDQIFDGNIASLKRFKDDVKEVREGFECGIVFEKFNDIMEGDVVEAYKMVRVERE